MFGSWLKDNATHVQYKHFAMINILQIITHVERGKKVK